MPRAWSFLGVVVLLLLCLATPAYAGEIFVTTTTDENDSTPGNATCDSPNGCSLRAAVNTAEGLGTPGPDTIHVPGGTYHLSLGSIFSLSTDITIIGDGARATILDRDATNAFFTVTGGNATIAGLTLTDGQSGSGGAVLNSATLTLSDVAIVANHSTTASGGVYNTGILTITGSTVAGNVASTVGGGLYNSSGSATVVNTTFTGNRAGATWQAGGIYNDGVLNVTNVTVAGNSVDPGTNGKGGGLYLTSGSTDNFRNTLVYGNTADPGQPANCYLGAPLLATSLGHNLDGTNECNFHAAGDLINTNPLLGPLQNNGGQTDTLALPAGSPAIDHGDSVGCPATDQRGIVRPQIATCDIGAFEYAPPPAPLPPPADTLAPTVTLAKLKPQSIKKPLFVFVTTSEDATVTVTATSSVPKLAKVWRLKGSSRSVRANQRTKMTITLGKRAKKAINKALGRRKKVKVKVLISAKDAVGNTRRSSATIRLKR
jgi:CSLREA domain-containing protein